MIAAVQQQRTDSECGSEQFRGSERRSDRFDVNRKQRKKERGEKGAQRRDLELEEILVNQQDDDGSDDEIEQVKRDGRTPTETPQQDPEGFGDRAVEGEKWPVRPERLGPDLVETRERVERLVLDDERNIIEHEPATERDQVRQDERECEP